MNISIHQNPFEREACAKAIRLLANSKHFDSVVDRFLKSSQGKVMKTETKITKIIFGSGDTQREHIKSTVFATLTHIFNTMIEKETYSVFIQVKNPFYQFKTNLVHAIFTRSRRMLLSGNLARILASSICLFKSFSCLWESFYWEKYCYRQML